MSKHVGENCGQLCISNTLSSKRSITPTKLERKLTTLKLVLKFLKRCHIIKFQLNMSKHVREKCGKMCISSIQSSKSGINLVTYKRD